MRAILLTGVVLVAARAGLSAQDPLGAAKELYASAAYEDALTALNSVDGNSTAPDIARQADEYRAFSLYALGRTREAESVAESMIRKAPLLRLDAADVSPRIEMMFANVRKRLLPSLIRERFRVARAALDQKSFSDAEPPLTEARLLITDAEKLGVKDDGLVDLSVLVDGFLQLIRSVAEQQASPRSAATVTARATDAGTASRPGAPPPETAVRSETAVRPASTPAAAPSAPVSQSPVAVSGQRVYSIEDEDVSPPVALDQRMTAVTMEMTQMAKALHVSGVLEVLIDESGLVVDATIRQSVNVGFDNAVLRSARRWKYRPALKNGVPVRYIKTLAVVP